MNLRKLRPWAFYFLAWTLVGLVYFGQNVTRRFYWEDPNPWQDLRYWSVNIYLSALMTPLIIRAARRWPLEGQRLAQVLFVHLGLSIAWTVIKLLLEASFHLTWNEFWPITPPINLRSEVTLLFLFGFHTGVFSYWVVLCIHAAIGNYSRFQERAQAALRSDLRASQLEPGDRFCFDVIASRRFWRLEGSVAAEPELVETQAGKFQTFRVDALARNAGPDARERRVRLWFTLDTRRLLVAAESETDLGPVRAELSAVRGARPH